MKSCADGMGNERCRGRSDGDLRRQCRDDERAWNASQRAGNVLLITAIADEQEMYGEMFRYAGIDLTIVCDGSTAFDTAVSTRARVIVIDLTPPDGGLDVIRRFRGEPRTEQSTIIGVSARVFPADQDAAERAGCDVFLPKPCLPEALVTEVRSALDRRRGSTLGGDPAATDAGAERQRSGQVSAIPSAASPRFAATAQSCLFPTTFRPTSRSRSGGS